MKKILLTNDDGIQADGIVRLAEVAKEFGDVWVVAPDSERSAMSHSQFLELRPMPAMANLQTASGSELLT